VEVLRRPDAVTVSTVHRVKGLEFPVVFVVDVEASRFPGTQRKYAGWLPPAVIQPVLNRGAYQSTPAEEVRLFYTALTRAERYLHVTGCQLLPGGARSRKQSKFTLRLQNAELQTDANALPNGLTPRAQARRIDETVMPTSYSEIKSYLKCPRDYQYRKSFGFSPPIPEMFGFGKTVHTAVGKLHAEFPNAAPTPDEAERVARDTFHLKHVGQSRDPVNRPGPYERARDKAAEIARNYASDYSAEFTRKRQVEAKFEIAVANAVISGAIDLLLEVDAANQIVNATVIDFKAMEGGDTPEQSPDLEWTDLSLQVQLYAKASNEVLGANADTGAVHLLKDNQRDDVPVDDQAQAAATQNGEWAVERILAGDFPMRPHAAKCADCDFRSICPKIPEGFGTQAQPPAIYTPNGQMMVLAFRLFEPTARPAVQNP
jgi:DNA helicase-2/ATP-dependent DNA helicase PcrA